ncbi:MAG: pyruvate formate lyase activating enzyme, partial [Armatimonadetes bacterium]|nr:pyruvate formate lyase activating enzyme [Armatimonadota bacterium]
MSNDFADLWVWDDPNLKDRLDWYRRVSSNELPAKYLIARRIPIQVPLDSEEEFLWRELERCTADFLELRGQVRSGEVLLGRLPRRRPDLVDLTVELSRRMLNHCNFCRWNCRVDRSVATRHGACQLAEETRVSSFFHHTGEELVYRGRRGSGTIFFTSCNMRCSFCQNGDISTDKDNGTPVDARRLATMAWQLRVEGCHNIN